MPVDPNATERPLATPSHLSPTGFSNHAVDFARGVQVNAITLSQMADAKASLLMSATFLVFTMIVSQAKSGASPLPLPLAVLALTAFLAAMCAVYATLPAVGGKSRDGRPTERPNLLFFGHFAQMPEQEWIDAMVEDFRSDEAIYRLICHDVYQSGRALQRKKYRYLGIAYRVFVIGLCLTAVTLVGGMIINRS